MNRLTIGGLYRMVKPEGKKRHFLIILQDDQVVLLDTPALATGQHRVLDVSMEMCFGFRDRMQRIA